MTTFVFFLILLHVSHHASGEEKVDEGDSAVLKCTATSTLSENAVVEWRRETPLLTVHIRRNNRDQPADQNELYRQRTSMRPDAHESRDLSLTLRNATIFDKGVYVCSVTDGNKSYEQKVELLVNLKNDAILKSLNDAVIWMSVFMVVIFIVNAAGLYVVYRKRIKG